MELKTILILATLYIAVRILFKSRSSGPIVPHGKVNQVDDPVVFKALISSGPVVVDFFATWCGPCKAVAPRVGQLSEKYEKVRFLQVDVDKLQSIAKEQEVNAMPTFLLFNNGQKVASVVGGDMKKLEAEIQKILG